MIPTLFSKRVELTLYEMQIEAFGYVKEDGSGFLILSIFFASSLLK